MFISSQPKKVFLLLLVFSFFVSILFQTQEAEARRKKKKSKGTIIVNQVLKLSGTMLIDGKEAPEFSGVKEGQLLETGEKSYAVVRIPGLVIFKMNPQTQLKLTKFMNRDNTTFELLKGEALFVFKRLGQHNIFSPKAKIHPIGNSLSNTFFISNLTDGDEVALWDGKIEVASIAGTKKTAEKITQPNTTENAESTTQAANTYKVVGEYSTKQSYLDIFIDDDSIEEEKESTATLPDLKTIQELESLYALP